MTDLQQDKPLQAYMERLRDHLVANSNSSGRIIRRINKAKSNLYVRISPGGVVTVEYASGLGTYCYARLTSKGFTMLYGETTTTQNVRKRSSQAVVATVLKKKIREFYPDAINNTDATVRRVK